MSILNRIFVVAILVVGFTNASAQCRSFAQKNCVPELGDYRPNGSLYSTYMENNQETELNLVLIGGQKYRLVHCHRQGLGKVWIQLFDKQGNLVYDNSEHDFATSWDFTVKATQEFKIKTFISGVGDDDIRSCAVLLLGNKFN